MPVAKFISTLELAKILGVSRVTIFNKIKKGEIKAKKVGRNFIIDTDDLPPGLFTETTEEDDKKEIFQAVKKTVAEYGETLRLLGKE